MIIDNVLIVDPIDGEFTGSIEFEDKILSIRRYDCTPKYVLMPGFADTHTHGYMGIDCMQSTKEEFKQWADLVEKEGVTYLFPTTVSADFKMLEEVIKRFSLAEHPLLFYLHLEGPFINKERAGAQNKEYITDFNEKIIDLEKVKIITVAPEIQGFFELLKILKENKVTVSIGHSNATFDIFKKAYEAGVNRITHFPNALPQLHHREIGIVGGVFLYKPFVEIIPDLIHLSQDFLRLVYKLLGPDRIILVTDSISATGLKDGIYDLGRLLVKVKDGIARLEDGTLAGSTLKYSDGLRNFKKVTNCSLKDLSKVSSYNALRSIGIDGGRIKEGYPAKFVLLNQDLQIIKVYS